MSLHNFHPFISSSVNLAALVILVFCFASILSDSQVDLSSDTPTYVLAAKLRRMGGACHATSSVCWSDVEDYDPNTYCKSELKARRSGELDATLCLSLSCGRRCVVRYLS